MVIAFREYTSNRGAAQGLALNGGVIDLSFRRSSVGSSVYLRKTAYMSVSYDTISEIRRCMTCG